LRNYAGSKNHSPHWIKEKKATLISGTVKVLYRQTKKALSERFNIVLEGEQESQ
jgi:hypothetical protein